ncbi:RPAP2 phosphatase, partial [Polypterus senegalus]|nr:putative RNA polymerase II subunit B1 CTD phosphatase rpap2 [Polypterus senegalus]MBN3293686.1 RPAP2 phosphatase [Polypterus senegalus]
MAETQRRRVRFDTAARRGGKNEKTLSSEEIAKRKEAIQHELRKKREAEQKALHIVQRLLECNVSEDFLIDCAIFISPSNYKDAVEERAIIKICGYPVCQNALVNVPKQQFKISTKTNKVYDITERKCFCSNFCYRASKYYEVQLPKTPLWTREEARDPEVILLKQGQSGIAGQEIKLSADRIRESEIEFPELMKSDMPSASSESESDDSGPEQDFVSSFITGANATTNRTEKKQALCTKSGQMTTIKEENSETSIQVKSECESSSLAECTKAFSTCIISSDKTSHVSAQAFMKDEIEKDGSSVNPKDENLSIDLTSDIDSVGISKKGADGLKNLLEKYTRAETKKNTEPLILKKCLLKKLKETLAEWKTAETLKFIYGVDYKPKCQCSVAVPVVEEELDEDDLAVETNNISLVDCELEVQSGLQLTGPSKELNKNVIPLPDYETVKKETELFAFRVGDFYQGHFVLPEEIQERQISDQMKPSFPLIDSRSQHAIRRHIVLEKLIKSLKDILGPFQLTLYDVSTNLNNLVRTFRFTNSNITHKNLEWTLIAVILLSVLSCVSPVIKESLQRHTSTKLISALMKELHLKHEDFGTLVQILKSDDIFAI